jgi:hypothetical protein
MGHHEAPADRFRYDGYELDPGLGRVTCRYSLGPSTFTEHITFGPDGDWGSAAAARAARLLFLLAGVSYFKTAAPPVVDFGDVATTTAERDFLRVFYLGGLAEFAHRNGLDLSDTAFEGPDTPAGAPIAPATGAGPLVPFGGGIDSIVTVEAVRSRHPDTALFVVSRPGARFEAIEAPAALTGLEVVRAEREIDPSLLRSADFGYLNGHVPVTGILSAVAVMAAVLVGREAVVMSNEWSSSFATLEVEGRPVNHQWSKGIEFEDGFRAVLAATFGPAPNYFSLLRARSELWVATRFASLERYHRAFRSCNRAFAIDPDRRLDHWCGECDKCCFIDLILSPYLGASELSAIFDGHEPLEDASLLDRFRALVAVGPGTKPFECVGEERECRAAVRLAAARADRAGHALLGTLAAEIGPASPGEEPAVLLEPLGPHFVPDDYAAEAQLV